MVLLLVLAIGLTGCESMERMVDGPDGLGTYSYVVNGGTVTVNVHSMRGAPSLKIAPDGTVTIDPPTGGSIDPAVIRALITAAGVVL
jgi:hypothetical protein